MAVESNSGNNSQLPIISEYEIVGLIAKGAMGEVYKANDPMLNRDVAIKVLASSLLTDDDAMNRFQREAKATAKIRHKNAAIIYGVGRTTEGVPYMAMEFVDGLPLADLIQNKTEFLYSQAIEMISQCCQGLEAAKREGVIHRDIKPSNIMILPNGDVKLVDFGLAKIFRDESFRTLDNMVMGTPAYMSPEQSLGHKSVDFRSDIYSLGASFYHLLTNELPFEADTPLQIMMKQVNTPLRSINVINPKVPHDLSDIVHRMMSKDREDRYQDYEELIHDLKKAKVTCLAKERNQGLQALPLMTAMSQDQEPEAPPIFDEAPPTSEAPPSSGLVFLPPELRNQVPQYSSLDDLVDEKAPKDTADFSDLRDSYRIPAHSPSSEFDQPPQDSMAGSPYLEGRGAEPGKISQHVLQIESPKPLTAPMEWWQKSLIALMLVMVVLAIVSAFVKPPEAMVNDPANRKSFLALFLQSLAGGEKLPLPPTAEMNQLGAYNRTRERVTELEIALQQYEARHGVLPPSLKGLVTNGSIPNDFLVDDWGQRFVYIRIDRRVTSIGPDGREGTSDDITLKLDGTGIVMPKQYEALKTKVQKQEEERAR